MNRSKVVRNTARIAGATVLAVAALAPAAFYVFAIGISAGLCGEDARWWINAISVAVPLLVVGSWGLLRGNWIFVAWPAAVLAGAACFSLARYLQPGAHGHCETMTPYWRSEPRPYSAMLSVTSSSPRRNVTPRGAASSALQPSSSRL
jgi:hypothetical protein